MSEAAFTQILVENLVVFATDLLLPMMITIFIFGLILKGLVYYSILRLEWFIKEFDKRLANTYEDSNVLLPNSFFIKAKYILEKTYYESFELRRMLKRRNPDHISSLADRLFLVQSGCARLVNDSLKRIKHLDKENHINMLEVSKSILARNNYFNKILGIFSANGTNQILAILPGIFIVGGIFGTFLGIMKALPELGGMDLNDMEATKSIMDGFLLKISFSMSTSIIGIVLSVSFTVVNAIFSPQKVYFNSVNRLNDALTILWDSTKTNENLDQQSKEYIENRADIELLAETSVRNEIRRQTGIIESEVQNKTIATDGLDKDEQDIDIAS